jgi:hypothetical protein
MPSFRAVGEDAPNGSACCGAAAETALSHSELRGIYGDQLQRLGMPTVAPPGGVDLATDGLPD